MMPFHAKMMRSTTVRVMFEVPAHSVDLDLETALPCCPTCHEHLDLHQPDETRPAQLMAICLSCSKWYLWLDEEVEGMGIVLVELPNPEMIRERVALTAARGQVERESESA